MLSFFLRNSDKGKYIRKLQPSWFISSNVNKPLIQRANTESYYEYCPRIPYSDCMLRQNPKRENKMIKVKGLTIFPFPTVGATFATSCFCFLFGSKSSLIGRKSSIIRSKVPLFGCKNSFIGRKGSMFGSKSFLIGSKSSLFGRKSSLIGRKSVLLLREKVPCLGVNAG